MYLCLAYLIVSILPQLNLAGFLFKKFNNYTLTYRFLPLIYLIIIAVTICSYGIRNRNTKLKDKTLGMLWGFYLAAIIIITKMAAGIFIDEIGKSPYDRSVEGMLNNMVFIIPGLVCREIVRNIIISQGRIKKVYARILAYIITIIPQFSIINIMELRGSEKIVIYAAQYILPIVIEGIILNELAAYGGFYAAFTFSAIICMVEWMFPVIPVLKWLTIAVIYLVVGGVIIILIYDRLEDKGKKYKKQNTKELIVESIIMLLCVLMIWFFVGVFTVYPSIVLTGSMEPEIKPGDIVLVSKFSKEEQVSELKKGDIITFRRDDIIITHRIKEVIKDESGNLTFRTKGDNNSVEDLRLVKPEEVVGKTIGTIPKLGIPVLWIKGRMKDLPEGVEF